MYACECVCHVCGRNVSLWVLGYECGPACVIIMHEVFELKQNVFPFVCMYVHVYTDHKMTIIKSSGVMYNYSPHYMTFIHIHRTQML